jgi:hypothetical protein
MNTEPLSRIADGELQERISRFSREMLEAETRYKQSKSIEDRAERDRCWLAQKGLLHERARRRRIVEAMEKGAGLA